MSIYNQQINKQFSKLVSSLSQGKIHAIDPNLLHGILGIANESGEIVKLIKKEMYYGASFSKIEWIEELGDLLYYIELVCQVMGTSIEELMFVNMAKLEIRYKNGYNNTDAIVRDKLAESKGIKEAIAKFRQLEAIEEVINESREREKDGNKRS